MLTALGEPAFAAFKGEARVAMETILNSSDSKSLWAIADFKVKLPGDTLTIPQRLLKAAGWDGILSFEDLEAVDRFTRYIGG